MRGHSYKQEQISKQDAGRRILPPIHIKVHVYGIQKHGKSIDCSGAFDIVKR